MVKIRLLPFFRFKKVLKRLIYGVILLSISIYTGNWLYGLYEKYSCSQNIAQIKYEICREFHNAEAVGNFCFDFCNTSEVEVLECPNYFWHDGKDFVVTVKWRTKKAILKARNLKNSYPFNTIDQSDFTEADYQRGLRDVLGATFAFKVAKRNAFRFKTADLVPWEASRPLEYANRTSLANLWRLVQDNEFIISQVLGKSQHTSSSLVFPRIIGSCGHFYLAEFASQILDLSYVISQKSSSLARKYSERLDMAIALMKFLHTLEVLDTGLQLCDVKFEHFALFVTDEAKSSMRMIDSDMIYHTETAKEAIAAIDDCKDHHDCDFIDCEGECYIDSTKHTASCRMKATDNNLKRICRNMLFMGNFDIMQFSTQLGLLSGATEDHKMFMQTISDICAKDSFDLKDLQIIYELLVQMRQQV
ncbi:hypothetical protein HDE_11985 [Halotydeus destructor]|nr:hypothetical protein HDE_11985 [Halotydeus destructor]